MLVWVRVPLSPLIITQSVKDVVTLITVNEVSMESKPVRVQALFAKQMVFRYGVRVLCFPHLFLFMSRTFRKPSQHRWMGLNHLKKVRDGRRTRPSHFCENNGGCNICEGNKLHKHRKQRTLKEDLSIDNQ